VFRIGSAGSGVDDRIPEEATMGANEESAIPSWGADIRRRYLRGEASVFVVHGNVHDVVLSGDKLLTLTEFLTDVLFVNKDAVLVYNVSTGTRLSRKKMELRGIEELLVAREPAKVLPLIERALATNDRVAVILEHADTIAPAGETSFSTLDDRAAVVTLHRWSLLRTIERGDSIVILVVENLSELNPKLVSNPRVATVNVPIPDKPERARIVRHVDAALAATDEERLSEVTAGLKAIQIASILTPPEGEDDDADRQRYLLELLGGGGSAAPSASVRERADKLAKVTKGMSREEIRKRRSRKRARTHAPRSTR
jgi:hypothetical protein